MSLPDLAVATPAAASRPHRSRRTRTLFARVWRHNGSFLALALAYVALSLVVGPLVGWSGTGDWRPIYVKIGLVPLVLAAVVLPVRLWWHREQEPTGLSVREAWRGAWRRARRRELEAARLIGALLVIGVTPAFAVVFSAWKSAIPSIQPFTWDTTFAALDRALHGGQDAWRLLAPLYESPAALRAVDEVYSVFWQVLLVVVAPVVGWWRGGPRRERFLVTYVLSWVILGGLLAAIFASAGPCYYQWATGVPLAENPYLPLMQELWSHVEPRPLRAVGIQARLLGWQDGTQLGRGISAFPSMHVGLAMLFVLGAWRASRWLRWLAVAFLVVTQVGSVALGWHYAVDGYAAIIGVGAIWWGVARWQGRRDGRRMRPPAPPPAHC